MIFPSLSDNPHKNRTTFNLNEWIGTSEEENMVPASHLKNGMILRFEKNLYKALGTEYHMGGGKMGSLPDEVYKPATLFNGIQVQVPKFIKQGNVIKVDVNTKKYIERAKR